MRFKRLAFVPLPGYIFFMSSLIIIENNEVKLGDKIKISLQIYVDQVLNW